ncbi:MAG: radical SAM protein, partial [Candidatus Thorarchaeota archaeon]
MTEAYPFKHHPCWSENRNDLWERVHLPVAGICNVKCAFCDHITASSCHLPRPGYASQLMEPSVAVSTTKKLLSERPDLRIVAVAGPGEPLANSETFATLSKIRSEHPYVRFCLSTNGVLLEDNVAKLVSLGVETATVTISTVKPETAALIYEWAIVDEDILSG